MRRALVLFAATAFWFGSAIAQTAVEGSVIDLAAETGDLALTTTDLEFKVEDLGGGVQSLVTEETDLQVDETETEVRIELAADVLFDFNSSDLRAEAEQALHDVAQIIRKHQGAGVRVEGHTDAKGSDSYNRKLSEDRAESVRDWLVHTETLHETHFSITGFGESKPAAANTRPDGSDDPEGRQKNRRVEIVVEKR